MMSKKRILMLAGALGLVALIGLAFVPDPVPVELARVVCGPMRVTVDEEGKTRVMERYLVSAPLSGRLRRIDLEPGDPVRAGQTVLASIDPADPSLLDVRSRAESEARMQAAEAARRLASADLEKARVADRHAQKELARARGLASRQDITEKLLEQAELQAATARQSVEAAASALQVAEFELQVARAALLHTQQAGGSGSFIVRSPIDGAVLRVFQESGGVVSAGTPLVEVADPRRLEIIVDLLSADAVKVQPGFDAVVENWGGEKALRARVRRVEPSGFTKVSALGIEQQRVNVIVDLVDPREIWASLGDGYRVETRIVIWQKEDAIKVPASAVFSRGEGFSVFVVSGGRARLRPVQIGKRNGLEAEAVDGLLENETVVIHPSDKVAEGVRVTGHAP
jgi:HlyD family secretion protein